MNRGKIFLGASLAANIFLAGYIASGWVPDLSLKQTRAHVQSVLTPENFELYDAGLRTARQKMRTGQDETMAFLFDELYAVLLADDFDKSSYDTIAGQIGHKRGLALAIFLQSFGETAEGMDQNERAAIAEDIKARRKVYGEKRKRVYR